jgi:hypothetical protein
MSRRFKLKDAKGNLYVAYKVSGEPYETTDVRSKGGEQADDLPRYELEDRRVLNYDAGTEEFEIIETGERLTRA